MEIILLRHGKPAMPSLHKITAFQFNNWVKGYNAAGLSPTSIATHDAFQAAVKSKVIVCSELLRSQESANALNKDKILLEHAIFNEADLPIADWNLFKLSPKHWAIVFRILWLMGYSKKAESFSATKIRAKRATDKLISICQEQGGVLLVGHGVFNKLLTNELKKRGWTKNSTNSSEYSHWGTVSLKYNPAKH